MKLYFFLFSFIIHDKRRITFRGSRQILSVFYDPWRGVKPKRDGHSLLPCARGNHACSRGGDCGAGMFFSLLYNCFMLLFSHFWAAKLLIFFELAKKYANFTQSFYDFF